MSGHRKRRTTDSLDGDRKRILFDRYDHRLHNKQEYNHHVRKPGLQKHVAIPNNYYTSVAPVKIQSKVVCISQQNYNRQNAEPYKCDDRGTVISNNYNSVNENRHCEQKSYITSLRVYKFRDVNFYKLRQDLSNIDIRRPSNGNFSTALDLTLELQSRLKYFVDTKNELIFLRKIQHERCVPFSYNEMNFPNLNELYNRIQFLEHVSAYRSNGINKLFHQLQSIVIASIVDAITYMHSVLYEKSWTHRKHYWYTLFIQIKSKKWSLVINKQIYQESDDSDHQRSDQNSHQNRNIKVDSDRFAEICQKGMRDCRKRMKKCDMLLNQLEGNRDYLAVANRVNVKSENDVMPNSSMLDYKAIKVEKPDMRYAELLKDLEMYLKNIRDNVDVTNNVNSKSEKMDMLSERLSIGELLKKSEHLQVDLGADSEGNLSDCCEIIETNVNVVNISEDDNDD